METRTFEGLMALVHKEGITAFRYDDLLVPAIVMNNERFDRIMASTYGKPLTVDSNLDIWHDEEGHVFVEIILNFSIIEERILLYANECVEFFEYLANTGIIALLPQHVSGKSANVVMIQLAKKDEVEEALEKIKMYMKKGKR